MAVQSMRHSSNFLQRSSSLLPRKRRSQNHLPRSPPALLQSCYKWSLTRSGANGMTCAGNATIFASNAIVSLGLSNR